MAVWRHYYNPKTDTHYSNGGFVDADAVLPSPDLEWREGRPPEDAPAWEKPNPVRDLMRKVSELPPALQLAFGGSIGAIRPYIEDDNFEKAIPLLVELEKQINAGNNEDAKAVIGGIMADLRAAGVIK